MSGFPPPPPPPPPHHNPFPKAMFFGTRVLPVLFMVGAVQMAVTNYINPMTPQQRAEIEERRKGIGFSNSRLSKENDADSKRKQALLSRDDSEVLSADNIAKIDLSHLDKAGIDDMASGSDWTHGNGGSSSDRSPR